LENQRDPSTRNIKRHKKAKSELLNRYYQPSDSVVEQNQSSNEVTFATSKCSATNVMSVLADDLLLYIMTFIVSSANAQVDGNTFRSISCVCKIWKTMANSVVLWSKADGSGKNYRLSAWKDISTSHATGVQSSLVGFVKVGAIERRPHGELIYTMRDRATNKVYTMKTRDMAIGCTEQLRELQAAHLIMGESFMDAHENTYCISLPIGVDIQGAKLLTWYRPTKHSLQDWFDTSVNCVNPNLRRVPTVLPIPLPTLKCWMRDLCTAIIAIYDNSNPWTDCRHGFHGDFCPKSIFVTDDGNSLCLACPLHMRSGSFRSEKSQLHCRSPDSLQNTHHVDSKTDMWALGCICAQIARCGVPLFSARSTACLLKQIHNFVGSSIETNTTFRAFLKREIPMLDEEGIDFIQQLLHPNIAERMDPRETLEHRFLSGKPGSHKMPHDLAACQIQRLLAQERLCASPDPTRYHVDDYQWAALTDWLFEMAEVLCSVSRQAVFQAMGYFEIFLAAYGEIPWERHQLALGSCFLLASQIDPNSVAVSARDLTFSSDNTFETKDVDVCLRFILENLKFGLAIPSISSFSHAYIAKIAVDDGLMDSMISFLSELALQTPLYLNFRPSLIAACVIVLAKQTLGLQPLWADCLAVGTGYKWQHLEECLIQLSRALEHVRISMPQLKMIARRYRGERHWQVGSLAIARVTSFASLTNDVTGAT